MHIISGLFKSRKIQTPKGGLTRPTSGRLREALFNICRNSIEGAFFLDLFAGSGAMGIEALSRGAKHATFVDNSKESVRCLHFNLETLGIENCSQVIYADVFGTLRKLAKTCQGFDIIYGDPPYDQPVSGKKSRSFSEEVLVVLDELMESGFNLLKPDGALFLEDAVGSLSETLIFKHFTLKDQRKMGRSVLQHWQQTTYVTEEKS